MKSFDEMNKAELLDSCKAMAGHLAVWSELATRTFDVYGETKVVGETPVHALHYLIDMGAKQSFVDVESAYAEFIGEKADGTAPAKVMKESKRIAKAKEILGDGFAQYNDSDMAHRRSLADLHFQRLATNKWAKVLDGSLTVQSRTRLSPDESWIFDNAEKEVIGLLAAQNPKSNKDKAIAKRRERLALTEKDASDLIVWRGIVGDHIEAHRAKFETRLADYKAELVKLASETTLTI